MISQNIIYAQTPMLQYRKRPGLFDQLTRVRWMNIFGILVSFTELSIFNML